MKEKSSEEGSKEGKMLRSMSSPLIANGERSSRRLKRRASLGSTDEVEEEEEEEATEGSSETQLASRPKRNITAKNLDLATGLSWKEENDLKKALYASLQETKRRDGDLPPPAMVARPNAAGKSGMKRSHSWTPRGTDESSQDSLTSYPNHEKDALSKAKVHAQRKFAQGSRPNSPNVTPMKVKQTPKKFFTTKKAKTEDFLTFLCLRGSHLLPPHMDFYNMEDSDENGSSAPGTPRLSSTGSRPGTPGLLGRIVSCGPVYSRGNSPDRDISSFHQELGVRPLKKCLAEERTGFTKIKEKAKTLKNKELKHKHDKKKPRSRRITCPFKVNTKGPKNRMTYRDLELSTPSIDGHSVASPSSPTARVLRKRRGRPASSLLMQSSSMRQRKCNTGDVGNNRYEVCCDCLEQNEDEDTSTNAGDVNQSENVKKVSFMKVKSVENSGEKILTPGTPRQFGADKGIRKDIGPRRPKGMKHTILMPGTPRQFSADKGIRKDIGPRRPKGMKHTNCTASTDSAITIATAVADPVEDPEIISISCDEGEEITQKEDANYETGSTEGNLEIISVTSDEDDDEESHMGGDKCVSNTEGPNDQEFADTLSQDSEDTTAMEVNADMDLDSESPGYWSSICRVF